MGLQDDNEAWERIGPLADLSRLNRARTDERYPRTPEASSLHPAPVPRHRIVVNEADAVDRFRGFLRDEMHLDVRGAPIADGRWHNTPVIGGHPRDLAGGYRLHLDGVINGQGINHKEGGVPQHWRPTGERVPISREEGEELARLSTLRRMQDNLNRLEQNAAAVVKARALLALSDPASADHPYLSRKLLDGAGFRQMNEPATMNGHDIQGSLLVPLYIAGSRSGLQRIGEDGSKEYLAGAPVRGSYAVWGDPLRDGPIVIATGAATAASIYAATRRPVYAAGSDSNLLPVAEHVRARFPERQIAIAGDNDQWHFKTAVAAVRSVPGDDPRWEQWRAQGLLDNPGAVKAVAAAVKIGATSVLPNFPSNHPKKLTDFSDVLVEQGAEAVRKQLNVLDLKVEPPTQKQRNGMAMRM